MADSLGHRHTQEPDLFVLPHRRPQELLSDGTIARVDVVVIDAVSATDLWPGIAQLVETTSPDARVVVLAADDDVEAALVAARHGVAAWLSGDTDADAIPNAIRAVADGHAFYPPHVLRPVLTGLRDDARQASVRAEESPLSALTEREREVLICLVEGRQSHDISAELDMAPNTVRTHTNRIFRKLGVHSRLEAVRIARHAGLTPSTSSRPTSPFRASARMSTHTDSR